MSMFSKAKMDMASMEKPYIIKTHDQLVREYVLSAWVCKLKRFSVIALSAWGAADIVVRLILLVL